MAIEKKEVNWAAMTTLERVAFRVRQTEEDLANLSELLTPLLTNEKDKSLLESAIFSISDTVIEVTGELIDSGEKRKWDIFINNEYYGTVKATCYEDALLMAVESADEDGLILNSNCLKYCFFCSETNEVYYHSERSGFAGSHNVIPG